MAEISKLGKGSCIIYNERPYRIKDIRSVVISKHSHTRTKVELEDVFTGSQLNLNMSPHDSVKEVDIPRKRGQLIAIVGDDVVHVMDTVSYETFDAGIEKELIKELTEGDEIIFVEYEGAKKVVGKRAN